MTDWTNLIIIFHRGFEYHKVGQRKIENSDYFLKFRR